MKVSGLEVSVTALWSKSRSTPVGFQISPAPDTHSELFCSEFPPALRTGISTLKTDLNSGELVLSHPKRGSVNIAAGTDLATAIFGHWEQAKIRVDRSPERMPGEFRIYPMDIDPNDLEAVA